MLILVCNCGSTSLKYKLFDMPGAEVLSDGKVERVGREDAIFSYTNRRTGARIKKEGLSVPGYSAGIQLYLDALLSEETGVLRDIAELEAVGFKTVLAKGYYGIHELTDEVLSAMEEYISVAPAHNPPYIEAIRVFRELLPGKKMIGCFETAFHTTIPTERRIYALPWEWYEKYGIQRMGYHGASHSYIAREIQKEAGEQHRLISCHLGGSGSLCAVENGRSVDTSFGFSLQTGIPHANRAGDLDAYIIPYLLSCGLSMEEILQGIDKRGGMLGISGVSNDLRDIEQAAEAGNARAALAISAFCNAIVKYIGAFYAELGGLEHLVFTGGIGENSALVREKVCSALPHLGIQLDEQANREVQGRAVISAPSSRVKVQVIPANEELGIAAAVYEQIGGAEA